MRFTKMHGLGNDYVYVNMFDQRIEDASALARAVSDRHTGVGSDGLILVCPSDVADVRMEMYNADGSRGPMCGNGARCVAKYAYEHGLLSASRTDSGTDDAFGPLLDALRRSADGTTRDATPGGAWKSLSIETDSGVLRAVVQVQGRQVERVCLDVGPPAMTPDRIPTTLPVERVVDCPIDVTGQRIRVTCVSVGSAHAVIFQDRCDAIDLATVGPALEHHRVFPDRINVHVVRVRTRRAVDARHWERGSGLTRACGTGACAICVAGSVTDRTDRTIEVHMPGGAAGVDWAPNDHVYLTGPAVEVFAGDWPYPAGECG
jgi:diaminopimelate epimerase